MFGNELYSEYIGNIAKTLTALRKSRHYTQEEVADFLHMNVATYSRYEQKRNIPPIDKILSFCELYNVSPNILLGYEDTSRINAICERYNIKYKTLKSGLIEVKLPAFKEKRTIAKIDFERILFDVQDTLYTESAKAAESKAFQAMLHLRLSIQCGNKETFQSIFESMGIAANTQDITIHEADIKEKRNQIRKKRLIKGGK